MQAYRIESLGSVDGIVLRSSDDPRPGVARGLNAGARELNYRDLMVLKGGAARPSQLVRGVGNATIRSSPIRLR
jgi:hypothetical protein